MPINQFHVESFLCLDKKEAPEEGRLMQQPKRCASTNNNKDEDNCPKNHNQNKAYKTSFFFSFLKKNPTQKQKTKNKNKIKSNL